MPGIGVLGWKPGCTSTQSETMIKMTPRSRQQHKGRDAPCCNQSCQEEQQSEPGASCFMDGGRKEKKVLWSCSCSCLSVTPVMTRARCLISTPNPGLHDGDERQAHAFSPTLPRIDEKTCFTHTQHLRKQIHTRRRIKYWPLPLPSHTVQIN